MITADSGQPPVTYDQKVRVRMQVLVSLILIVAGFLILTSPNRFLHHEVNDGVQKIAAGWIGAVVGYWLS